MPFAAEADARLRHHRKTQEKSFQTVSRLVKRRKQEATEWHGRGLAKLRAGPIGLGDSTHPINHKVFSSFYTCHKGVVTKCSDAFRANHGGLCADGAIWGDHRFKTPCTSTFCKVRDTAALSAATFQSLQGFLMNVCRLLRARARAAKGQITMQSRHFLFFIRVGDCTKGWLVTNPHFKPLTFEGVALSVPEKLDVPFQVSIATRTVQSCGVARSFLSFITLDEVARDLASLAVEGRADPDRWEWCHATYKLFTNTPLSVMHITEELSWVPMGQAGGAAVPCGPEDNDCDASEDEHETEREGSNDLDEICEMVAALHKPRCPEAKSKPKPKTKPKATRSLNL